MRKSFFQQWLKLLTLREKSKMINMKDKRKDTEMTWNTLSSEKIFDRPWLTVRRDKVQLPNGHINDEYYTLHYPDWINVIAETTDGQIILERQYRHALGRVSIEIPAGVIEQGENPLHAAQRELKEETGYEGGQWTELMTISANPSTMDNLCHCFLAKGVTKLAEQHLDYAEDLEYFLEPKTSVRSMLLNGKFIQALMIAPLYKYFFTDND